MYAHTYIYAQILNTRENMYICTYVWHMCVSVSSYMCVYYVHLNVCVYVNAYVHLYLYVCKHVNMWHYIWHLLYARVNIWMPIIRSREYMKIYLDANMLRPIYDIYACICILNTLWCKRRRGTNWYIRSTQQWEIRLCLSCALASQVCVVHVWHASFIFMTCRWRCLCQCYVCLCTRAHTRVHTVLIYTDLYICMYIHTHAQTHTNMRTHIRAFGCNNCSW